MKWAHLYTYLVRQSIKSYAIGCSSFIVNYISHVLVFNCRISENCFLRTVTASSKFATVCSMKDLRYISVLPAVSKLFEFVMNFQLRNDLPDYNLLPICLYGFQRNYGCRAGLLEITNDA